MSDRLVNLPSRDQLLRAALFVPCNTKEALHNWVTTYLGFDIPNCTVDPESTSNPMDLLWECYQICRAGGDEETPQILTFAARDSFKTLIAAIIEVLMIVHLDRSVAHMAAIEAQAGKCQDYVRKFMDRPFLRDFKEGDNKRKIVVTRYTNRTTGKVISPREYEKLAFDDQSSYEAKSNTIEIIIATIKGANSAHVPFMVMDELDIAPEKPVREAGFILSPAMDGGLPLTLMISSRKTNFGLVQKEIDRKHETGLKVRHWNIIDVTQACPPTRHLPQEPQIQIYYSKDDFSALSFEQWNKLDPETRLRYESKMGYQGCLSKCSIFAACQGNLATRQLGKSKVLKSIPHVVSMFKKSTPDDARAQLMSWEPSKTGSIYPRLTRELHMKTPGEMAEILTGDPVEDPENFTKDQLIQLMRSRNMEFHAGMDFGYTHNWSTVVAGIDGNRSFVVDCYAISGLEVNEKVEFADRKIKPYSPVIYPDEAYPSDIKTFRKAGYTMRPFTKNVLGGIEAVRAKIWPGFNRPPEIYFLAGDEGCELLFKRLTQYHWVLDDSDRPTDTPDEKDDDEADALRYLIHGRFGLKNKFQMATGESKPEEPSQPTYTNVDWMHKKISELTGGQVQIEGDKGTEPEGTAGSKAGFFWDL